MPYPTNPQNGNALVQITPSGDPVFEFTRAELAYLRRAIRWLAKPERQAPTQTNGDFVFYKGAKPRNCRLNSIYLYAKTHEVFFFYSDVYFGMTLLHAQTI